MATSDNSQKRSVQAVLVQIYGENINKRYPLNGSVMHVGRALNAHVRVNTINVSRMHCVLKKEPGGWLLKDCGSFNGTYVNGKRLLNEETVLLQFGDILFLGPPSEYPIAFCFEDSFDETEQIWPEEQPVDEEEKSHLSSVIQASHSSKYSESQNTALLQNSPKAAIIKIMQDKDKMLAATQQTHNLISVSTNNNPNREQNSSKKSKTSSSQRGEKSDKCSQFIVNNQEESENSQSLLDVEGDAISSTDIYSSSQRLNSPVSSVHDKNSSQETGKDESAKADLNNSDDLKSRLALLSKEIEKLEKSKSDLLKEYAVACEKNKLLDQQLTEQKKFTEDMHMYEQRLKNKFKDKIMGQLEEDLICNICTELLIKPTVLDCSHTFCEYCIKAWKKKKRQCPVCRNHIQSETRILALDHFIDKTLETLTPEQKETRRQIILQREHQQISTPTRKKQKRRRSVYYSHRHRSRPLPTSSNDIQVQLTFAISPVSQQTYRNDRPQLVGSSSNNLVPEILISDDGNSSADGMDF